MGTILASAIIGRAEDILQDFTNLRWQEAELLGYLNDAQREIVLHKPDANVVSGDLQTAQGARQTLPAGGIMVLDVVCNMGASGTTPGAAVIRTTRDTLDRHNPSWHAAAASATTKNYWVDVRVPSVYWVYPPQPSSSMGYLKVVYSATPTDIASAATAISLDDIYAGPLLDFVLYRACNKTVAYGPEWSGRAQGFYQSFLHAIGNKEQAEGYDSPTGPQTDRARGR